MVVGRAFSWPEMRWASEWRLRNACKAATVSDE
jgi:hypothetical protein